MKKVTENAFINRIISLKDTEFQNFTDKLHTVCYGNNYTAIKQKRDKGCDGILNNETVLAVYAPEKHHLGKFKKKISDDFDKYSKNWMASYPKWQVIYNGTFTAEMVQFIKNLKSDAQPVGLNNIMEMIVRLRWSHIQHLSEYLNIDSDFLIFDIIDEIIRDLLKAESISTEDFDFRKLTEIERKIEINFQAEDIERIKDEYEDGLKYFDMVKDVIGNYEIEKDTLKNRVRWDIAKLGGDFKTRFDNLTEDYASIRLGDDYYKLMVRVLLIYLFEQCVIGRKEPNAPASS